MVTLQRLRTLTLLPSLLLFVLLGTYLYTRYGGSNASIEHFDKVIQKLASMLHIPIGLPVTNVGSGKPYPVQEKIGSAFEQAFPLQEPTPDTWKYWQKHFLNPIAQVYSTVIAFQ